MTDTARPRGRPPRTTEQRAAHRLRLVEAVMDAIRERGPDLSLDDMADAAGVSKPVLYDEFGGRLGIADAVALLLAEHFERDLIGVWAHTPDLAFGVMVSKAVDSLIDLVETEPQLYAFLVRSIRSSDRGFLDNALVRAIHGRALLLMRFIAPALDTDAIAVLTDGLFGFMFAAVESWLPRRLPPRAAFVDALAAVVGHGIQAAIDQAATASSLSEAPTSSSRRRASASRRRGRGG